MWFVLCFRLLMMCDKKNLFRSCPFLGQNTLKFFFEIIWPAVLVWAHYRRAVRVIRRISYFGFFNTICNWRYISFTWIARIPAMKSYMYTFFQDSLHYNFATISYSFSQIAYILYPWKSLECFETLLLRIEDVVIYKCMQPVWLIHPITI